MALVASSSVQRITRNYPDHREKSERQKRGQWHELLPVVGLWIASPNISVTTVTAFSRGSMLSSQCTVVISRRRCSEKYLQQLRAAEMAALFFRERIGINMQSR